MMSIIKDFLRRMLMMINLRKKRKSFTVSTLITFFIVAMLVISGPAQAVQVSINTYNINDREIGETGFFYVNITIGANERIPIANISVVGLPNIPGSPGGELLFNVSDFNSVGAYVIKDNYNISLIDRHGWVGGYGYGYGYDNNNKIAPYYGYGNVSQFYGYGYGYGYDYGYGYGYGYGNPDTYTSLNYKITVDTTGAEPKVYDIVAKVNTGRGVLFQESESFELIDNTPPASVTDLHNTTYAQTYINWTWIDPADADFANVSVWIDGTFKDNVSKGTQFYNAMGFAPDTEHTIATRTMDKSGNTNLTWVNRTDRTAPTPPASTIQVTIEINPQTINLNSNGVITVSVLNNTPAGFDVADINVSTVRFAGNAIALSSNIAANKLILKFNTKDTNIQCGDTQATLTGKTYTGEDIVGSVSIVTGGCGGSSSSSGGSSSRSSNSGGGGGGSMGSRESFDNIVMHEEIDGDLRADHSVAFNFSKAGLRIKEILIKGKENEVVSVRVEALKGKPRQVDISISDAKYINIVVSTKKIKEAQIMFMVENYWIQSAGISRDNLKLYRWSGGNWSQLETIMIAQDANYTYYKANTTGFSSFAIAKLEAEKEKQFGTISGNGLSSTVTETPEATTESPSKKAPLINPAVIVGLIALIAAIKRKYIFKR
jgi:PGF-pre-PGF domain-containing protein